VSRNAQLVRTRRLEAALEAAKDDGISITEFAQRHNYNRRTVHRDMVALQAGGLSIRDENGRWFLERRAVKRTRAAVTASELHAFSQLRTLAVPLRQLHLGQALDSAHAKLTAEAAASNDDLGASPPLPAASALSLRQVAAVDYARNHRVIASLEAALARGVALQITYAALASDEQTARTVEPATLHYDAQLGSLYLIAWCRLRAAPRVFAVHRILAASLTTELFAARPEVASERAAAQAFRIWRHGNVRKIVVRLVGSAAKLARERAWHPSQTCRDLGHGAVELAMTVAGLHEICHFLLQFGGDAEALAPPELRDMMKRELTAALTRYTLRSDDKGKA